MFTGIIEEVGTVKSIGGGVLAINAQKVLEGNEEESGVRETHHGV